MRVLLNATAAELNRLGGDFTHYRDWLRIRQETLSFELVPDGGLRSCLGLLRKIAEKATRTWQPTWFRRHLFLLSRFSYAPAKSSTEADLIFSHLLFPWTPGSNAPVIWNSQGISPRQYYDTYNRGQWTVEDVAWMYGKLGRKADALVIFTHSCARNIVSWCPELAEKIHVVPAPVFVSVDEAAVKPSVRDGVIRVLFVGIDAERKGLPEVVEAYRGVRERFDAVRLDIVSRPSRTLQEKIAGLKDAHLYISSPQMDVKALMEQADIFLLPTHADTYALAAIEAMAHGCAVIVSDLEPLPEVIPDGQVGFNVPIGDASALAAKLERILEDTTMLRAFQRNARERFASLHEPDVVAMRLQSVFSGVLRRKSGFATQTLTHQP
jgi:glycosyltransferase involved in cell wall biosynthesis